MTDATSDKDKNVATPQDEKVVTPVPANEQPKEEHPLNQPNPLIKPIVK